MAEVLYKELSFEIVGAAMEVHKVLGPGYPEQIYQSALERELGLRRVPFTAQHCIEVPYKGATLGTYYLDLVVDGKIITELKAVSGLQAVHQAQVLAYLRASRLRLGLLINFGEASLRFKRIAL